MVYGLEFPPNRKGEDETTPAAGMALRSLVCKLSMTAVVANMKMVFANRGAPSCLTLELIKF